MLRLCIGTDGSLHIGEKLIQLKGINKVQFFCGVLVTKLSKLSGTASLPL